MRHNDDSCLDILRQRPPDYIKLDDTCVYFRVTFYNCPASSPVIFFHFRYTYSIISVRATTIVREDFQ